MAHHGLLNSFSTKYSVGIGNNLKKLKVHKIKISEIKTAPDNTTLWP